MKHKTSYLISMDTIDDAIALANLKLRSNSDSPPQSPGNKIGSTRFVNALRNSMIELNEQSK